MTKFEKVLLFILNELFSTSHFYISPDARDVFHQFNDKILEIVDDVFISLKIDKNFKKTKNVAELLLIHQFMQNVSESNYKKYEEIHNTVKTKIVDKKTAHFIFIINEMIEEMITGEVDPLNRTVGRKIVVRGTVIDKHNSLAALGKGHTYNITALYLKVTNNIIKNVVFKLLFANPKKSLKLQSKDLKFWVANKTLNVEMRRIFNGRATSIREFPFMVSVHIDRHFSCAGTIISKEFIITAASCLRVFHTAQRVPHLSIFVRVGSDFTNRLGELVPITEMYFHPQYDLDSLSNNLAILKTKRRLTFNEEVRKISVDTMAHQLPENIENILILGWGAKSEKYAFQLRSQPISFALVDVYDIKRCKNIYSSFYVKEKNFCTGYVSQGSGACNYDIGGPAVVGSTLTGVISFGSPYCGRPDAPTVFSKLGYYAKWINSIIMKNKKGSLRDNSEDDSVSEPKQTNSIQEEIDTLKQLIGEIQVAEHINSSMVDILKEPDFEDGAQTEKKLYQSSENNKNTVDPQELNILQLGNDFPSNKTADIYMTLANETGDDHDTASDTSSTEVLALEEIPNLHNDENHEPAVSSGKDLFVEAGVPLKYALPSTTKLIPKATTKDYIVQSTQIGDILLEMTISTESESSENNNNNNIVNEFAYSEAHTESIDETRQSAQELREIPNYKALRQDVKENNEKNKADLEIVLWNSGTTKRLFATNRKSKNVVYDSDDE